VIVPHAGIDGHCASTLANLALEKMGVGMRVSDDVADKAQKLA
jgi:hypothetical protein